MLVFPFFRLSDVLSHSLTKALSISEWYLSEPNKKWPLGLNPWKIILTADLHPVLVDITVPVLLGAPHENDCCKFFLLTWWGHQYNIRTWIILTRTIKYERGGVRWMMGVLHNIRLAPPPVSCRPLTTGGQVKETLGLRPAVRPSVPARARPVTGNRDRKAQCHPCTGQRGRWCQQNNWENNCRNHVGWQHFHLIAIVRITNVMSSGELSERKWRSIGVGWSWLLSTFSSCAASALLQKLVWCHWITHPIRQFTQHRVSVVKRNLFFDQQCNG